MTPAIEYFRSPDQVMKLARMGSAHPMRLSFLRVMLRRMAEEGWRFERRLWEVDAKGVGRAVYCAMGPQRSYSLVAFAHDLPDEMRSDRVIATAWDATFALFDGVPSPADLDRLAANVPLQEAGRITQRELSLSRANRSVRLFNHLVERLATGQQPDPAEIDAVGYLMRTTAVYGSGKFGAADRAKIAHRAEVSAPFQAEMLSVWLTRWFTVDIVNHLAAMKGGDRAVRLDLALCHRLGVGNSTGLGMAPFLVRHPVLLNNWMAARETALARVRALERAEVDDIAALHRALDDAMENAGAWRSEHPAQVARLSSLRSDLVRIKQHLQHWPQGARPWNSLWLWGETALADEGQEALLAIMLEPHAALVDDLAEHMQADEMADFHIDGAMSVGALRGLLRQHYAWALAIDFVDPAQNARFWYVSEEKLEPRLGARFAEDGAAREQPLGIARLARDLFDALSGWDDATSPIATFLLAAPEHRMMVRRTQMAPSHPYAEVQDNLIAHDMLPIDLMRCKLAFFGASHFDPRSDKWVRISLFRGAPYPFELGTGQSGAVVANTEIESAGEFSRTETESLCLKATRGAGYSWGIAEDAARAAGWLCAAGVDGTRALLTVLTAAGLARPRIAEADWLGGKGSLCPLMTGTALCDHANLPAGPFRAETRLHMVQEPVLLLPFLADCAQVLGRAVVLQAGDLTLTIGRGVEGDLAALAALPMADVTLTLAGGPLPNPKPARFAPILPETLRALDQLALRTTVPASEASRRSGAGAAIDDND